jgi:hypothetical protein
MGTVTLLTYRIINKVIASNGIFVLYYSTCKQFTAPTASMYHWITEASCWCNLWATCFDCWTIILRFTPTLPAHASNYTFQSKRTACWFYMVTQKNCKINKTDKTVKRLENCSTSSRKYCCVASWVVWYCSRANPETVIWDYVKDKVYVPPLAQSLETVSVML